MAKFILFDKARLLFIILLAFFICNALIAELIGVKIFSLEDSLGLETITWKVFNHEGGLNFTAGVLLWPVVFIMTDIINEYFGKKGVLLASYITVGLIIYSFGVIYLAINLAPADWWISISANQGIDNMQNAFSAIFGQGLWIITGSIVAFFLGQWIDIYIFQKIKKITGEKKLWLRATGSTLISQLIDSFVVLYIAFVLGPQQWSLSLFFAIALVNYSYKFFIALILTPLLYFIHGIIDRWLGKDVAFTLKTAALKN